MGWGRWLLLGDLGQQLDLEDQRGETDCLRRRLVATHSGTRAADKQLKELQREIDELKLYLSGALRLLTKKGVVSPQELEALVGAVDEGGGEEKPASPPAKKPPNRPPPHRTRRFR